MEGANEDDHSNNLQKISNASFEASMQQEHPMSLILTDNNNNLVELSVEQNVPIGDSVTLSPKVENSDLKFTNEDPDDFPSSSNEAYESKEGQDSITVQTSEVTSSASFEVSMQQEQPISLILTDNKSISQEISVDQTVPVGDSVNISHEVENSELLSTNEVPGDCPSSTSEASESKEAQNDSIAMESSELNISSPSQSLIRSREDAQDDAFCTDSEKAACETPSAILKKVKEDKPLVVHKLHKRQMSLVNTKQKVLPPVSRSNTGKYSRTDNTIVDTRTHIESVKAAASKFGGSVNWKTRRTQPAQGIGTGHIVLELDKVKNEISECKRQAEVAEASKMSVLDVHERTNTLIDKLKHVLETQQAEEVDATEDLEFFQFIAEEMEEGVASDDSGMVEEKLKTTEERHQALVGKLKLVEDESRKVQEDIDSLLIERDISIRNTQAAITVSKETKRQVDDLTVELNRLKGVLDLAHATCHDAEERKKAASMAKDNDCFTWENDLKQAKEELSQFNRKLSSVEELKSQLDASSSLLLNLRNELATYMEEKLIEEAREQEGGMRNSVQEEVIPSMNELEEHRKNIAKVTDELCHLKVTVVSLKSELNKGKVALSTLQQTEAMSSITVQSLKMEVKLSLHELEVVHAKEECRDRMVELPKVLQDTVQEADEAKSVTTKAQSELRKTKEEVEQAKAVLRIMESKRQAVLREIEVAKESERLTLNALTALEDTKVAVNIEQQGSPQMITLDLGEYTSLIEKAHRAEELVHQRTATAIAQVEVAKESESQTLSRLNQTYKALEERKKAFVAAREKADNATKGKVAMEQELRKWREENRKRRKACEASKSEAEPLSTAEIIMERSGDVKSATKEENCASVHPLSDVSWKSSPSDLALHLKTKKQKNVWFFPRVIMFLGRRRLRAVK